VEGREAHRSTCLTFLIVSGVCVDVLMCWQTRATCQLRVLVIRDIGDQQPVALMNAIAQEGACPRLERLQLAAIRKCARFAFPSVYQLDSS
jgi:hypothetical protein